MITLGKHRIDNPLLLAPMVGVTDRPFRELCLQQGAGLVVGEMLPADSSCWQSRKNRNRRRGIRGNGLNVVQIAGFDPAMMAEAARLNAEAGADVIDINMGCPARKVLKKAAGSALLRDPALVQQIVRAVVQAVAIPVTLKIRTGWSREHRNGVDIGLLAQDAGIQMLSVHGRTRECRFLGEAEYDTIAAIKQALDIPVIANGDITSPEKARQVLQHTGADGLMIGRAAQGRPWIFAEIKHFLNTGQLLPEKQQTDIAVILLAHTRHLHHFYGEPTGILFARKHISWYSQTLFNGSGFKTRFNKLESGSAQLECIEEFFSCQLQRH
ncbi:MAG: tRNA dihydrouridine synthase DusB [Pseudomonadales bacterium]|nr:tRNA dihydrouridine synthase DusB [Pseudomonadales bacterium]